MNRKLQIFLALVGLALLLSVGGVRAQGDGPTPQVSAQAGLGTAFTYQGQLKTTSGSPVNGNCDMAFRLYDAAGSGDPLTGGNPVGSVITTTVPVTDGLFVVGLDFGGGAFNGDARWLEIAVKCRSDPGFTTLSPRQALTAVPYALYAPAAGSAPWSGLTGVPAGFADGVDDTGSGGWAFTGNSGTSASNFIGTTDNMTLTFQVSNTVALRIVPAVHPIYGFSPNIIGGYKRGNSRN